MQAVLATAVPVNDLGILMLKLGEHLGQVGKGRVVVMRAPDTLASCRPGLINITGVGMDSALLDDQSLYPLWSAMTSKNRGMAKALKVFVESGCGCQLGIGGEHCHKEMAINQVGTSWVRVCWICDQEIATGDRLQAIANHNQAAFWLYAVAIALGMPAGHPVTFPELCWYLTVNNMLDCLPDNLARKLLGRPESSTRRTVLGDIDTNDLYLPHPSEQLTKLAAPVAKFVVDSEPPLSFIPRPKPMSWRCEAYTRFVKAQPCVVCQRQADDPHHLIGHGHGKMGGKSHDLFVIPLCRQHHDDLHRDVSGWERQHGSQLQHVVATLDKALKVGALV